MASSQWIRVWANSGRWWRTGKPGVLQFTVSQSWTRLSDWPTRDCNLQHDKYNHHFPGGAKVNNLPTNAGDAGDTVSIAGFGRSCGIGNSDPFQYSRLEDSMDRGPWQTAVHGVTKVREDWTHTHMQMWACAVLWASPGGSDGEESTCNAGDPDSVPRSGRFPCRNEWPLTPVFLPGEFHGQRSLASYSPWGPKELDTT